MYAKVYLTLLEPSKNGIFSKIGLFYIGILLVSLTLPETLVVKFAVYAIYIYGQASHKESKRGLYKLLLQSTGGGGLSSEWQ